MTDASTTDGTTEGRQRQALVVRGGWFGHQPKEATEEFIPFLEENGFTVRIEESPEVYADAEYMATVDLVVQTMTMSTIEKEQFEGLQIQRVLDAVERSSDSGSAWTQIERNDG